MKGQMTLTDIISQQFFDRFGNTKTIPGWVSETRCGNCQFWQLLPEYDQPPNGWGVRGLCGSQRSRNMYTTAQTSYCQEWKGKTI